MTPSVLIIAAQRDLRRDLFDIVDREGPVDIFSARDVVHAAALLREGPPLQLVVLALAGDDQSARHCCEQVRRLAGVASVPLLVVLSSATEINPLSLPGDISDWLYAERAEVELIARWRRAQSHEPSSTRPVLTHTNDDTAADYRFAFEDVESEWLIADLVSGRILEVSSATAKGSGMPIGQWRGLALSAVLQFEGVAEAQALADADHRWFPCQRKSAQGFDRGQVSVRPAQHAGHSAVALLFRSNRVDADAAAALTLLPRFFSSTRGVDASAALARLLFDELRLDYLAVWSVPASSSDAPRRLLQLFSGEALSWPAAALQSLLQWVLGGKSILSCSDSQRLAPMDPLLQQIDVAGLVGLPLFDERQNVLGAVLLGRRDGFGKMSVVEPMLGCAAARFAQTLELVRAREQAGAEGLLDALTGLPNRLLFNDRLDTTILESARTGSCFAVLLVDLDHFKTINDNFGRVAGDQVLREVAQRLRSSVRASDTVARCAGDEFSVILRRVVASNDVQHIAEKIVRAVEAPLFLEDGRELRVTASLGLSFFPDDAGDAVTLLTRADEAMCTAKHRGRNNFHVYEASAEYAAEHGVTMVACLRHAEDNDELRVVYQPQVDTVSEDIIGMEALVRWEHPQLGLIGPDVFIPLAEANGLIVSIGAWVMRTACRQAKAWELRYGLRLRLGVNLSALQLMEPLLLDTVAAVLSETGLDPALLELEVTESVSIKAAPNLLENLHALHELGCHIAIDDFGTGAASLDYLRRLPADRIKIDQSFVRNIGVDPDDEAIVRATIDMAHRLNRAVVAEGVELEQHLDFLRALHCDELQGYLFSRPLSSARFGELLAERQRLLAPASSIPATVAPSAPSRLSQLQLSP
ncbi:MAG: EAL domain-containing protein [Rhodanobacter sp.]